jgi:hypothetical protein
MLLLTFSGSRNFVLGSTGQRSSGVAVFAQTDRGLQITFIQPEHVDTEIKDKVRAVIESYTRDGNTVGIPEGPKIDLGARTTVMPTQLTTEGACDTSTRKPRTTSPGQQLSLDEESVIATIAENTLRTTYRESVPSGAIDAQRIANDFEAVQAMLLRAMRTTPIPETHAEPVATAQTARPTGGRVIEARLVTETPTEHRAKVRTTAHPQAADRIEPISDEPSVITEMNLSNIAPDNSYAAKERSENQSLEAAHPRIDIMPTEVIPETSLTVHPGKSTTTHQAISGEQSQVVVDIRSSTISPHGSHVAILRTAHALDSAQPANITLSPMNQVSRTSTSPIPVEAAMGRATTGKGRRNDNQESMSAASSSKSNAAPLTAVFLALIASAFIAH